MDDLESFFVSFWGVWAHFQGGYVFQTSLATEVTFTVSPDPPKSPETNVPRRNAGETQGIVTADRCVPGGVGFRPLGRILVVRWDQGQSDFEERKICVDLSAGQRVQVP